MLTNSLQQLWKTAGRVGIKVGNLGYLARDISPNGKKNLLVLIYSKLHSKSFDYVYKHQGRRRLLEAFLQAKLFKKHIMHVHIEDSFLKITNRRGSLSLCISSLQLESRVQAEEVYLTPHIACAVFQQYVWFDWV